MNVGKKIIEIRKERNMTQEDFAKVFHVTRQINGLLVTRKEEVLPIIKRAVELWDFING